MSLPFLSEMRLWIRSFIKRQTSNTSSDNEWYNKWQRVPQRVTTNDKEWLFWLIFFFFLEEPTNGHPKENPLNLEEDFEEDLLNWEEI